MVELEAKVSTKLMIAPLAGFIPHRVTYASDYFPQLYEYAKTLISRGHAYVCEHAPSQDAHQKDRAMEESEQLSQQRSRPVKESLELLEVGVTFGWVMLYIERFPFSGKNHGDGGHIGG